MHKDPHPNVLMSWKPKTPEFDSTYVNIMMASHLCITRLYSLSFEQSISVAQ